jgi:transposase
VSGIETTFESKSGGRPRRRDVIPAGAARRMWSPDFKARIVEESFAAGANIAAIARPMTFYKGTTVTGCGH